MSQASVAVIIVAAGSGTRLGLTTPKAFVDLAGRTLLERAVDAALAMTEPPQIVVVAPAELLEHAREKLEGTGASVVVGGATRQASVAAGLAVLDDTVETVLVHDAARALTPSAVFDRVAAEVARRGHGAIPALAVVNTIKQVEGERLTVNVDRSVLRAAQTPQGFPRRMLVDAYADVQDEHTDDAALVSAAGHPVAIVDGDPLAFKITTPFDLTKAVHLVSPARSSVAGLPRTGIGIDVHALDPDRPLWLGGVFWPDEVGLAGHSDGDVLCHAICDALLSAAGLGDLGSRFGTDDPALVGAHGDMFITRTVEFLAAAGFAVGNVAVQVVGNRPIIGLRRAEIETRLTTLVGAPISVSATTTDGLGLTGRGEGIAAVATCLIVGS